MRWLIPGGFSTALLLASSLAALSSCQDGERSAGREVIVDPAVPTPIPEATAFPDRPLTLGRPPHLSGLTEHEYEPLANHLAKVIGHPVEMKVPGSYGAVTEMLVAGELDFALLTPLIYVRTRKRLPQIKLLATLLGEGSPRYRGYIVAPLGSGMRDLLELKGKRFAFVDEGSTSGYLFPLALLRAAGLEPKRDFASLRFAGGHARVVELIHAGEVDAGAISSTTLSHLRAEGVPGNLDIVAKTPWIPFDAFVAHPSVAESVAQSVRAALIALNTRTPEGRAVLTGITTTNGFVSGDDGAYDTVREVVEKMNLEVPATP